MKRIIYAVMALALAAGCAPKPNDIVLTFNVTDPVTRSVVVVCQNNITNVVLEDGKGEAVFTEFDAAYAKIFCGMSTKKIYMERGDRAVISFNGSDFDGTFSFDGDKKAAVDYLQSVTLTPLADEDYALGFAEYVAKLNEKRDGALKLLKANSIKGAGDFVKTETGRIKYAYATPLLMYPVGHMIMAHDPSYKPDAAYYDVIRSYFVEEEGLIDVDEYRNFIIEAAHVLDEANREVTQIKQKTVAQMNYITDNFSSSTVNASLLHYLAASYVQMYGIDDIQEMLSLFNTYVKDPALVADFQKKYDKWDRSKPGKPSPDFKATDVDGKVWTLADFKGKYVYIDLWATWCNPCKKELPYLKELEKKFEGAEIVFLSLSTDGDKAKWEKMVKEGKMSGVQLHIGPRSDFQLAYNIDGIPRFILLDKEGVIINNNMSRPSSDDTIRTLESLDGIRQ